MDLSNYYSTVKSSSSTSKEDTVFDKSNAKKHASTRRICPSSDFNMTSSSTEELNYHNESVTNILIRSHDSLLREGKEEGKEAYSSWRRLLPITLSSCLVSPTMFPTSSTVIKSGWSIPSFRSWFQQAMVSVSPVVNSIWHSTILISSCSREQNSLAVTFTVSFFANSYVIGVGTRAY